MDWLSRSVMTAASMCAVISLIEHTVDDNQENGFRMVAGAVVACNIVQMIVGFMSGVL